MENYNEQQILFSVTEEDLQTESKYLIGRKLTEDELYIAKKGIESCLSFDLNTAMKTAIEEAVEGI